MKTHPLFRFFSSFPYAVALMLSLAFVLAVATGIESVYGTRAVQVMVYRTSWFSGLLFLLIVSLTAVAISRYPWKRHQTGFVLTHLGIITLLVGAGVTSFFGIDGNLPVTESTQNNSVVLNDLVLGISEEETLIIDIPVEEYGRREQGKILTVGLGDFQLVMDEFLPRVSLEREVRESPAEGLGRPAIQVTLSNDRFSLTEWLVYRQPGTVSEVSLGPATLSLEQWSNALEAERFYSTTTQVTKDLGTLILMKDGRVYRLKVKDGLKGFVPVGGSLSVKVDRYLPYAIVEKNQLITKSNEPRNPAVTLRVRDGMGLEERHTVFALFPEFATHHGAHAQSRNLGLKIRMEALRVEPSSKRGSLQFAVSSDGKALHYKATTNSSGLKKIGKVEIGKAFPTGWMDLNFRVDRWVKHAVVESVPRYVDKISGSDAGLLSAAHFRFKEPQQSSESFWLIEGGERLLSLVNGVYVVSLRRKSMSLPFKLDLDKFTVRYDPGTEKAASYESRVRVVDGGHPNVPTVISMNEPLKHGGYTFYQASYQLNEDGPPISIFSVNKDPGRWVKYAGSLVLVLGICLMFYMNPHYWNILLGQKKGEK